MLRSVVKSRVFYWRFQLSAFCFFALCSTCSWGAETWPPADQRYQTKTTTEVPDFQRHVVPLLGRLGCNSRNCHGSFQGRGDFRLSLFGYNFAMDHNPQQQAELAHLNDAETTSSGMQDLLWALLNTKDFLLIK